MTQALRVLELFCGIGGGAAALGGRARILAAVDIDRRALEVYSANFPHAASARTIEAIPLEDFRRWESDLWWMSPPCQPYTRRGCQRDLADPRAAGLRAVIARIPQLLPPYLAMENVPPFQISATRRLLCDMLDRCQYQWREFLLCPTELGIPNRRARYYLVAGREALHPLPTPRRRLLPLSAYLEGDPAPALTVPAELMQRYAAALDLVDPNDAHACSSCFTAAYGHSHIRSGSYLRTATGARRFAPREILRLLEFPATFQLPAGLTLRQAWRLLGNSLSVAAVRHVLAAIPALADG